MSWPTIVRASTNAFESSWIKVHYITLSLQIQTGRPGCHIAWNQKDLPLLLGKGWHSVMFREWGWLERAGSLSGWCLEHARDPMSPEELCMMICLMIINAEQDWWGSKAAHMDKGDIRNWRNQVSAAIFPQCILQWQKFMILITYWSNCDIKWENTSMPLLRSSLPNFAPNTSEHIFVNNSAISILWRKMTHLNRS